MLDLAYNNQVTISMPFQTWIVSDLLSGKSLGTATPVRDEGFSITRLHRQSLMLHVKVALGVIANDGYTQTGLIQTKPRTTESIVSLSHGPRETCLGITYFGLFEKQTRWPGKNGVRSN